MTELRDQSAHFVAAFLSLLPAVLWPNPVTFALAGFAMGMAREVTEEGAPVTFSKIRAALNSKRDLSAWTLGGFIVGFL